MGNSRDILGIVDGSSLEEYDDFNIGVSFRKAAAVSIAHTLLRRCGYEPENYFEPQDYEAVFEWDTPEAVTALGTAVSENTQMVLRQIERTIRSYERSQSHDRDNLHDRERRPAAEPEPARDGANRPLREDAPEVSAGAPAHTVEPAPDERDAVAAPARDGETAAQSRIDLMLPKLAAEAGATEALKAADPMKWTGLMNSCKAQAEEVVLNELIYN